MLFWLLQFQYVASSMWVHPLNNLRFEKGEFYTHYPDLSQHQSHWCVFLFLSNLFNSLKIRHIVHTQHCKHVHIKYVQTLMLMTLMLTMHNGTSMIKNVQNLYLLISKTGARSFCLYLGGVLFCVYVISYFFCNCARGLYFSGYALISCDFGECHESVPYDRSGSYVSISIKYI